MVNSFNYLITYICVSRVFYSMVFNNVAPMLHLYTGGPNFTVAKPILSILLGLHAVSAGQEL